MSQVTSPYNFVPAPTEEQVYKPDWASQVSHDIPFSDGESGEIELKITAQTPIFIRNGHIKDQVMNEFSHYFDKEGKKHYFIPGSSLKGMFRNVMEIMSFSRMEQIKSDDIFALRDMNNRQYSNTEIRNTKTGWLFNKEGKWVIYNCSADRVRMESISRKFNVRSFNDLSGKEKYVQCNINNFETQFNFKHDCTIPKTGEVYNIVDGVADKTGFLVMFGAMQNKKYDYIFQPPNLQGRFFELTSQDLVDRILDIENNLEQSLWLHFFTLGLKKIPVFYKLDNANKYVIHFGFSKLYKLNNTHYLRELEPVKSYLKKEIERLQDELKYDLASLIFGHTKDNDPLKGRVMIGNAISSNAVPQNRNEERVLGSPKPSFYPAYLTQPNNVNQTGTFYNTYLTNQAVLRGFKRYPIHLTIKNGVRNDNENIASQFIPLNRGAEFQCKIRFHNLKKVEIGALLSAITFHNTPNSYFSLGSAKPYGFGQIKVEIIQCSTDIQDAQSHFEYQMNLHTNSIRSINSNWLESKYIKELLPLTQKPTNTRLDELLVYPKLEDETERNNQRKNQFNNVKKDNLSLKNYSELNGIVIANSLLNPEITEKINNEKLISFNRINQEKEDSEKAEKQRIIEETKKHEEERLAEEKRLKELEESSYHQAKQTATIPSCEQFISKYPLSKHKDEIAQLLSKLKAQSGIPERLLNLKSSESFFKEGSAWIKKLPKGQLLGSGFEDEILSALKKIALNEFNDKRTAKAWNEGHNLKKLSSWIGEDATQQWFAEIKGNKQ